MAKHANSVGHFPARNPSATHTKPMRSKGRESH